MTKPSDGCIFIACDAQDVSEAATVTAALERQGLPVWAGPRDAGTSDPGQYAATTRDAAGRAGAFVLLLSGRPVDLAALGTLTAAADAAGKPIYPVRVTEQASVPDFPALQRARSWIDATGARRDAELARLAGELRPLVARPTAAPAPAPAWGAQPAAPAYPQAYSGSAVRAPSQPLWMRILFIVVGIILMIGGIARIIRAFH